MLRDQCTLHDSRRLSDDPALRRRTRHFSHRLRRPTLLFPKRRLHMHDMERTPASLPPAQLPNPASRRTRDEPNDCRRRRPLARRPTRELCRSSIKGDHLNAGLSSVENSHWKLILQSEYNKTRSNNQRQPTTWVIDLDGAKCRPADFVFERLTRKSPVLKIVHFVSDCTCPTAWVHYPSR